MIVVSDASPLISLSVIGRLDILRLLYGRVVVPEAVWREITAVGNGKTGSSEIRQSEWLEVCPVSNRALAKALESDLDAGEAEAIALAVENNSELLLIDERKGRAIAKRMKLNIVGVIGVLFEARQKGFIPDLKPVLDELIMKAGFRISQKLYEKAISTAGIKRM